MKTNRTYLAKTDEISRKWHIVDLNGLVLGRAATQIALILRGKNKPQFTPSTDTGDFIVAINAEKIKLTGNKLEQKKYYRHSGFPGGLKEVKASKQILKNPEQMLIDAVKGMLPKSVLGRELLTKLKIYVGGDHPHAAQQPKEVKLSA